MAKKNIVRTSIFALVLTAGIGIGVATTLAYNKPITINMPDYCFGYQVDHSIIDLYQKEDLIQSGKINEDNSISMTMSRTQQKKMLASVTESAEKMLQQIPYESITSNILAIDHNRDFTKYKITLMNDTYNAEDTRVLPTLTYIQAVYGSVQGKNKEDLTLQFMSEDGKQNVGIFTLSHIGTEEETKFEKKFMETYEKEMLDGQDAKDLNLDITKGSNVTKEEKTPDSVIENQIKENGMN